MNNPYLAFIDFIVALRLLRNRSKLEYPEFPVPPQEAFPLFERECNALFDIARQHGFKGGTIKILKKPICLPGSNGTGSGWTNMVLSIQERTLPRGQEHNFEIDTIGPWNFNFLFEQGLGGIPQNQYRRIALRYALGHLLRLDYPCSRCFGRGCWVSSTSGRTTYGIGVNLMGDSSKPCFRCLGYQVDPEFWDNTQAQYGEFYDDPVWPLPSAANNEFFEHKPARRSYQNKKVQ